VRLLVVEDDKDLNRQIVAALTRAGYAVDRAFDGEEGWFLGDTEPYDAIVLDLGLPKKDGASVLSEWRRAGRAMPVLILTARDRWSDKVQGFDAGADDYVAKPFHIEEILARLRASFFLSLDSFSRRSIGAPPRPISTSASAFICMPSSPISQRPEKTAAPRQAS
jgi:DNA-binding response OmpR family regulator